MLFNPHSQIQEEPTSRSSTNLHPGSNSARSFSSTSPSHNSQTLHSNHVKQEDWLAPNPFEDNKSPDISKVCVSYDIYGNELSTEDGTSLELYDGKDMDLESIEEEGTMSPDTMTVNQENNDPVLHLITPVKKRETGTFGERARERGQSFAITRNPLLDITPANRKRKCSYQIELPIERSLLNNATPKSERGEISFTKKLR